jgi:hypothetical protein
MTRETANELWGPDVVDRALRDEHPEPITRELTQELARRAKTLPLGAFRAWTLTQPWPKFVTIVAIISGAVREEFERLAELEEGDD